jgi:hypothetical protein
VTSDTEVLRIDLRDALQPAREQPHLCRRCPLLWSEHRGSLGEPSPDVARDEQRHPAEAVRRVDRAHRREPAVGRRGAAEAHDDLLRARIERVVDQLARAHSRRGECVVAGRTVHERQARRRGPSR